MDDSTLLGRAGLRVSRLGLGTMTFELRDRLDKVSTPAALTTPHSLFARLDARRR